MRHEEAERKCERISRCSIILRRHESSHGDSPGQNAAVLFVAALNSGGKFKQ